MTRQATAEILGLEIDGMPATYADGADAVVNIFTDLPVDPFATSMETGGSSFIMHFQLLGDAMLAWSNSSKRFRDIVDEDWINIVRWFGFYVRRDWPRFDEHAKRYWSDDWPVEPSPMARHDAIHRALEVVFLNIFPTREYLHWNLGVRMMDGEDSGNWEAIPSFAEGWVSSHDVAKIQRDLFDVLNQFVQCRWQLLPGMILNVYRAVGIADDPTWRITRDDFTSLRDLNNAIFEQSYKILPTVMAFNNCLARGAAEQFPDGTSWDLTKLERKRAVDKENLLKTFKPWGEEMTFVLNRQLRNAIGHTSATHNLASGEVIAPDFGIRYADFVAQITVEIQALLLCLNVVKLLAIGTD